jgi:hypothetical protein
LQTDEDCTQIQSQPERQRQHTTQGDKIKSEEDYLTSFHDKLLEARKETTDFINLYMTVCYGILTLVVLFVTGYIPKLTIGGAEFKLDQTYAAECIVALLIVAYLLMDFHLIRLSRLFREIRRSGVRIKGVNRSARLITVEDLHLFMSGLSGLVLALARAQMRDVISRIPIDSFNRLVDVGLDFRDNPTSLLSVWKFAATSVGVMNKMLLLGRVDGFDKH